MPQINRQVKALAKRAKELGALDAKIISAADVFTGAWVRMKCRFGCGGFGQCLTCPPHSPTPMETQAMLAGYETALLVHGRNGAAVKQLVVKLEHEAFLAGLYKAFAMGDGPCDLCSECAVEEGECRYPDRARPAMEACGIDVFKTVRTAGLPIEVLATRRQEPDFYGLVLLE